MDVKASSGCGRNRFEVLPTAPPPAGSERTPPGLPGLLSVAEVAGWLRTSTKAVYAMAARGQIPAPIRIGRRLLFEREKLLSWLEERRAVSPTELRR